MVSAILVKFSREQKRKIERAVAKSGLRQGEFCRRAILAAANGGGDAEQMIRQIHAKLCGSVSSGAAPVSQEAKDAVAVLVGMGIGELEAVQKVNRVTSALGDLQAAEIIREAMSDA